MKGIHAASGEKRSRSHQIGQDYANVKPKIPLRGICGHALREHIHDAGEGSKF